MSFKVAPRETIVKCTAYDNKFRAYPEEVKLKAARIEKARIDSKETEAMRYERLMTQKFLAGHYVIESPRLALLAKAGKVLLIVALFPPFFIFVTFPRYTFETLLPKIYSKVEEPIVKLAKNVAWISKWSIDVFNVALGKVARKLKINLPRLELPSIKFNRPETLIKTVKKPVQITLSAIKKTIEAFIALKDKAVSIVKPFQKAYAIAVNKLETYFEKIEENFGRFANFFKAAPPPVRAYGQKDPVPAWQETLIKAKERIEKAAETIKEVLSVPLLAVTHRLEPVYNFVSKFIPVMYNEIQNRYESVSNAIKSRILKAAELVNSAYEKVEGALVTTVNVIVESINHFLTPYYPIPGRIAHSVTSTAKTIKSRLTRKIKGVLSFGHALKKHAKSFHKSIIKAVKKVPALLEKAMKNLTRFGVNFLKALRSFFIILGVTIKILYLYIRDLNQKFINRQA